MANVKGTAGHDDLLGTDDDDEILGLAGNDTLDGAGGDDTLIGGPGADTVIGNSGNDDFEVSGHAGEFDALYGGDGYDRVLTIGTGAVFLDRFDSAAAGIEEWRGRNLSILGNDDDNLLDFTATRLVDVRAVDGRGGNDTIIGSDLGDDILKGGAGDDTVVGNSGDDDLEGNSGDDVLDGGRGRDKLFGGAGDDTLLAGEGNDTLDGGGGNDVVDGGAGDDTVYGGRGDDVGVWAFAENAGARDYYDGGKGFDTLELILSAGQALGTDLQDDIAAFRAFLAVNANVRDLYGQTFTFTAFDLEVRNWEAIELTHVNEAPIAEDDASATDEDNPVTVAVLDNDRDADVLDQLSLKSVDTSGTLGLVLANPEGSLVYDPGAAFQDLAVGETAIDSFTYTIEDLAGETATATVSISVSGTNDAPTAGDDRVGTDQNTVLAGNLFADNGNGADRDPDAGDQLVVSLVNGDSGNVGTSLVLASGAMLTVSARGTFAYDPAGRFAHLAAGQTATETFDYTVSDGHGESDTATVEVTVSGRNDAPTAEDDVAGTDEDSPVTVAVLDNDGDVDALDRLAVKSVDTSGTLGRVLVNPDNILVYDPATAFRYLAVGETAIDSFTYTVEDLAGATATATVSISVAGVNDAPTAQDAFYSDAVDGSGWDFPFMAADVDADDNAATLTYTIIGQPAGGRVVDNGDGTFRFDPESDFRDLGAGETREVGFIYTATDRHGAVSVPATVSISVTGVNDAPAAEDDVAGTDEDSPVTVAVLDNDGDADVLDRLTVKSVDTSGTLGLVLVNPDGILVYDPATAFRYLAVGETAIDSFTYTVEDLAGATATATVSISVAGVNDAPAAEDDVAGTDEDSPVTVAVLDNDGDADVLDRLTVKSVDTSGTLGLVLVNPDGSLVYDPGAAFQYLAVGETAIDSFTYTIEDLTGETAKATVSIAVTGVNDAPTAGDDVAGTDEDSPVTVAVLDNDGDADVLDRLTVKSVDTSGTLGLVLVNPDGSLVYDPGAAFQYLAVGETAIDSFTYTIEDLTGETAKATVSIAVTGVNDAPTAEDDGVGTDENTVLNGDLFADNGSGADGDPDTGDQLVVSAVSGDAGGVGASIVLSSGAVLTVAADGTFDYDPAGGFEGLAEGQTATDIFEYAVSDGHGGNDTAVVEVTVSGRNDAPTAENLLYSGTADGSGWNFPFMADDVDADDDAATLVHAVSGQPAKGRVVDNGDGTFRFDPGTDFRDLATGETREVGFTYTASDRHGAVSAPATVIIAVTGVNRAPTARDDGFVTDRNTMLSGDLFADNGDGPDGDPDAGDILAVSAVNGDGGNVGVSVVLTSGAVLTVAPDGTFEYDPAGQAAIDTFEYTVSDGRGGEDSAMVTVTVSGRGSLDAFVANFGTPDRVWLNDGNGGFADSGQTLGSAGSLDVALGDLDGDGDLDAFMANYGSPNRVWVNDGSGVFTDGGQALGTAGSWDVALGDLDGDGDIDAFVANDRGPNRVWRNDGNGHFTDSGRALGNKDSWSTALGDLDGDGDLDAFVTNFGAANQVWVNDGNGNFSDSGQAVGGAEAGDVALGDLDGDGDLDAFVANSGASNHVWLNDGSGHFSGSGRSLDIGPSTGVALGDLDGDGDLDAFVANFNVSGKVLMNDGNGVFTDSNQALGSGPGIGVALGDLDGDGDLDAFVANNGAPHRLWLNDGSGNFTGGGQMSSADASSNVALGDLDGDALLI